LFSRVFADATVPTNTDADLKDSASDKQRTGNSMKINAAAIMLLALSSTTSLAVAAEKGFTYRYTKTYFVDQGGAITPTDPEEPEEPEEPEVPEEPKEECGTYTFTRNFSATRQAVDGNGDCVFSGPKIGSRTIGFDYTTAAAFCASTMNGGGRIAEIEKEESLGRRGMAYGVSSSIVSQFNIPGISSITCSTEAKQCGDGLFQNGSTCQPVATLSCGRLNNDLHHIVAGGNDNVEMPSIGECKFLLPQVTISNTATYLMAEGKTMGKWRDTLATSIHQDYRAVIKSYELSGIASYDNALWKNSQPSVPRLSREAVDSITIADLNYGTAANLPPDLTDTPLPSTGYDRLPSDTLVIRFTPNNQTSPSGWAAISEIRVDDVDGVQIKPYDMTVSLKTNLLLEPSATYGVGDNLADNDVATGVRFNSNYDHTAREVTLKLPREIKVKRVWLRAQTTTNSEFPLKVQVYAKRNAQTSELIMDAPTKEYSNSQTVGVGQWVSIDNAAHVN
jgi:hypothetical protein